MDGRGRAIEEIVTLARQHQVSAVEIAAALGEEHATTAEGRRRGVIVRVLGFIGGTFIFAGIGVFIALQWESMNSAARVVITLGSGVSAFSAALLSSREARFDKATTPLFLMAAALQPTGMLVAFDEFGSGGDWRLASLATCGTMALQFGATFRALSRSTLLFMCILFTFLFWWTLFDLLNVDNEIVALVIGGSLLLAAMGVDRTPHRVITPLWYFLGATGFLYGVFDMVEGTPIEMVFLMAAAAFVYLSVTQHSRTLLFVATAAILAYTGYFTSEHFADSVGWPIALIIFGIFMIGLSALAFRIDRDYVRVRAKGTPGLG
ncbi:MAG: DUF2157 domain-containing protein [Acidobacteria bacterium]|nr:DUF2157 domain-containing protein [Acidobacteriota bacterium]